ncbi:Mobile element protein [Rhodovulum sp. P5]|nr:Mobile element protein [Rhodovulum sp. P5]
MYQDRIGNLCENLQSEDDDGAAVHHRLPDRIRAHALICFLALVLYRVMRMRLKAKGHDASPRTALDMLARIHRHEARIADRKLDGLTTPTPNNWTSSTP